VAAGGRFEAIAYIEQHGLARAVGPDYVQNFPVPNLQAHTTECLHTERLGHVSDSQQGLSIPFAIVLSCWPRDAWLRSLTVATTGKIWTLKAWTESQPEGCSPGGGDYTRVRSCGLITRRPGALGHVAKFTSYALPKFCLRYSLTRSSSLLWSFVGRGTSLNLSQLLRFGKDVGHLSQK
jgi:hypothetical protein